MVSDESLISKELKDLVGKELASLTQTTEIEGGQVAHFVDAIEHPNAKWVTEWETQDAAKELKYKKGTIVPSSYLWTRGVTYRGHHIDSVRPFINPELGGVDGGSQCEIFLPVRVGDVIIAKTKLASVSEHKSETRGKLLVIVFDTTYNNQKNELVGTFKQTIVLWSHKAK